MKRYSILTDDITHCIECGQSPVEIHEIFFGPLRNKSIKYGLCVPLCREHHRGTYGVHGSRGAEINLKLKKLGQKAFEKHYTFDFIDSFGRNYLD